MCCRRRVSLGVAATLPRFNFLRRQVVQWMFFGSESLVDFNIFNLFGHDLCCSSLLNSLVLNSLVTP